MKMSRTFSTVLFHTVTVWPELSRFLTMPLPMMPRPRNPKLSLLGWMSFSLNIWLLVTWRDKSEVANMVAAKQICMIKIADYQVHVQGGTGRSRQGGSIQKVGDGGAGLLHGRRVHWALPSISLTEK